MPRADRQAHHDELGEDERRERDAHHVDELVLEQDQRAVHDDAALVDADQHPQEKRLEVQ